MKAALPCCVAQYRQLLLLFLFPSSEEAADQRIDCKGGEDSTAQARGIYLSGISHAGKLIGSEAVCAKALERAGIACISADVRRGYSGLAVAAEIRPLYAVRQHHQPVGTGER